MTAWERGGWWAVTAREREEEGQRGCQSGMGKWVGRRRGGAESGRAPRPGRGWWVVWGCGTWAPGRGGASGAEEGRRRGSGVRGARGAASPERSAAQRSGRRSPPGQPPGQVSQRSLPADPRGATRPGSPRPGPREGAREQGGGPGPRLSLTLAEVHRPQPAQLRGAPGSRSWGSLACLGGPLGDPPAPCWTVFWFGRQGGGAFCSPRREGSVQETLCFGKTRPVGGHLGGG